jgi:hypothetical protein
MKYHSPTEENRRLRALREKAAAKKAKRTFSLAGEDILEFEGAVAEGAAQAQLEITLLPPKRKRSRRARSV